MREVGVLGVGATPCGRLEGESVRALAVEAGLRALSDAGAPPVDVLYVANMSSEQFSGQNHLGAVLADELNMGPVPAFRVEAACASGGAGFHQAWIGVASGVYDTALVVGVEKMTGVSIPRATSILAGAADWEHEVAHGATFPALNALMARAYMERYGVRHEDLMRFSVNAHERALGNELAMLHKPIDLDGAMASPLVADPLRLYDCSPVSDGAAAVVLAPIERVREAGGIPIVVRGSRVATDTIAVHDRRDILDLRATREAGTRALSDARLNPRDVGLFEVHDAFTIMAALSLEALGVACQGEAWCLAADQEIAPDGRVPVSTMGGLKARGHPVGATGLYQIFECVTQLRGESGKNQVPDARVALAQNVGGTGSTVAVNVLEAET